MENIKNDVIKSFWKNFQNLDHWVASILSMDPPIHLWLTKILWEICVMLRDYLNIMLLKYDGQYEISNFYVIYIYI